MIPVGGTILIIATARNNSATTMNFPLQWLGTSSYSIYLWHWPVVAMLNATDHLSQIGWKLFGIFLSLILGHLSFLFIEKRTRYKKQKSLLPHFNFILLSGMLITIGGMGCTVYWLNGINNNLRVNMTEKDAFIEKYKRLHLNIEIPYRLECDFNKKENQLTKKIDLNCTRDKGKDSVFLWGDSTAQALSFGLRAFLANKIVNQIATSACPPSIRPSSSNELYTNDYYCNISNQYALKKIKELKPRIVIASRFKDYEKTDWNVIADYLHSLGVKYFIVVGPGPGWPTAEIIVKKYWNEKIQYIPVIPVTNDQSFIIDQKLKQAYAAFKKLEYISVIDALCQNKKCITFIPKSDDLISLDGTSHLTPLGSVYIVKKLLGSKINHMMQDKA